MKGFTQCVSVWIASADELNNGTMTPTDSLQFRLYSIYHILIIFWIPFLLLIVTYSMTLRAITRRHSNGSILSCESIRRASQKAKPNKQLSAHSVLLMITNDKPKNNRHSLYPKKGAEGLRFVFTLNLYFKRVTVGIGMGGIIMSEIVKHLELYFCNKRRNGMKMK